MPQIDVEQIEAALAKATPEMVEAACEARNLVEGTCWTDGTTEGVQAIERMLAERMIVAALKVDAPARLSSYRSSLERVERLTSALTHAKACYWVNRADSRGAQQYLDTTWHQINAALGQQP